MIIDKAELVSRFGEAILGNAAAIFVGAGTSIDAGFPDWNKLLAFARRRLGLPSSFSDLALLAQYFVSTVPGGRDVLEDEIIRQLQITAGPTITHNMLSELPIDEYWTTNYDTLLDDSIPHAQILTEDTALARLENSFRRRVYKLHGTLPKRAAATPSSVSGRGGSRQELVIAREDFEKYPRTHPRMWAQLMASFLTKSLLFVGISFNDPNIMHLFKLAREQTGVTAREHFTIMRHPKGAQDRRLHDLRIADLTAIGIRVCQVEEYREITELLSWLVRRTRAARVFVSGSTSSNISNGLLKLVGSLAADTDLSFVTAGPAGRVMCYSFASALLVKGSYNPERLIMYFQAEVGRSSDIEERFGTVRYYGASRSEMLDEAIRDIRALFVIGGGRGTFDEVKRAVGRGTPVVPLACTGGAALKVWETMSSRLEEHQYGGKPIKRNDFELLNHPDQNIVARHAIQLLRQAVYLD